MIRTALLVAALLLAGCAPTLERRAARLLHEHGGRGPDVCMRGPNVSAWIGARVEDGELAVCDAKECIGCLLAR